MYVLDTNVVSELRKLHKGIADKNVLTWINSVDNDALFLSAMTVMELELGVRQKERRDAKQGKALRVWLESLVLKPFQGRILAIDGAIAQRCGGLHIPDPQPLNDSLIAATALVHGMTVVTRNVDDFKRAGVSVINPWIAT